MNARRSIGTWAKRHDQALFIWCAAIILVFLGVSVAVMATDDHAMSFLDEHVHYDTALKMNDGELSYRGALYEEEVVDEWVCGVGHQAGGLVHGCGDPLLNVRDVTSGQYTTGYIHYPTYFAGAEVFRAALAAVVGPHHPLSEYRLFSAVLMWVGVLACGVFAYLLGIRRWGLIAAVTLPAAATSILVMATMVTPNSTSLLAGALVAGTGLLWIRRGRGFVWLALAALFASCTAVINSLPIGGFILLIVAAVIARARNWSFEGPWRPRIWHGVTLALIVVAPVIAWGRYIVATATATNAEVYGQYQLQDWRPVVVGAVQEVVGFHSPWTEWSMGLPPTGGTPGTILRAAAAGIPLWVTIAIVGALILSILGLIAARRVNPGSSVVTPVDSGPSAATVAAREPAVVTSANSGPSAATVAAREPAVVTSANPGPSAATVAAREPAVMTSANPGPSAATPAQRTRLFDALRVLAVGTLLTMILYPAALRVSNALNFGIDYGIVARYSMAFAPLLVLLALLLVRRRIFAVVLALLGVVGIIATAGVWV